MKGNEKMPERVSFGLEQVLSSEFCEILAGKRVGLLTHQAAIGEDGQPGFRALARRFNVRILFGPEHGFFGAIQDALPVGDLVEPSTGLPVKSLFGTTRRPDMASLGAIDTLVVDLQDVGVRFYTYATTMAMAMEACAQAGVEVVVLDRPNPIGAIMQGPMLRESVRSFLGYLPVPLRHGLTIGELALYHQRRANLPLRLRVVPVTGWRRTWTWPSVGRPWQPPSPNLPTYETARLYPGTCLIEGTNLSEGRGTTRPFELIGAPWVEPQRLADRLAEFELPGVLFTPVFFEPTFGKYQGLLCGGVQVHVTDETQLDPLLVGLNIICATRDLWPDQFQWQQDPETKKPLFDLLIGDPAVRARIEVEAVGNLRSAKSGLLDTLSEEWRAEAAAFQTELDAGGVRLYA